MEVGDNALQVSYVRWIHEVSLRVRHSHQFPTLSSRVEVAETLSTMRRTWQVKTAARGMRSVCLPCRRGCVAKLPLQVPQGSLTSTTFREQLRTLSPKELRSLQSVAKGDRLAGDASSNEATTLRRIPEVRVRELVAEPVQVGDMRGKFTDGVPQTLVQMGRSSLVALRRVSTQRTTRHAEAGCEDRRVPNCRCARTTGSEGL